jgi:hypothetical protein
MIITTFICDRCKKVVASRDELYELELTATGGYRSSTSGEYTPHIALQSGTHWCRECLIQSGMFNWTPAAPIQHPETPPTLEELIRQIVASAVEERLP